MLQDEGADLVEIGFPFSDPLADGPVIQHSTHEALSAGMTVARSLDAVRAAALDIPVIAFSYLNPIIAYGRDRFLGEARDAGISGLLITDLPVGADPELEDAVRTSELALIRLVALTTSPDRLATVAARAEGFLYLIARLGVTGAQTDVGDALPAMAAALRDESSLPVAVGFGIGTGRQAREVAAFADGVVVGSALVKRLAGGLDMGRELMRELRTSLDAATVP